MSLEIVLFVIMVGVFLLSAFLFRLPVSLSMLLASLCGIIYFAAEENIFRHLIEGGFSYFDILLIIITAMVFIKVLEESGAIKVISSLLIKWFHRVPPLLLIFMIFLVMVPGMLTGSATVAVLTLGPIAAPVFLSMGIPRVQTAAIIAMGAIAGGVAPPINVPAMIICVGMDMPYVGFGLPLLFMSVPAAIFAVLWIGLRHTRNLDKEEVMKQVDLKLFKEKGVLIFLPLVVLIALMVLPRVTPAFPDLVMPLIFLLSAFVGLFSGKKLDIIETLRSATKNALPVMGILFGVGMFIQVMTLTGVRGLIVVGALSLPTILLYIGIALSLPLFGALSSFGAASVLGVPFGFAFLGSGQEIITIVGALTLVAGLGDLTPPTALAGIFAAQVLKLDRYEPVLKHTAFPVVVYLIIGMSVIIMANHTNWLRFLLLLD